MKTIRLILVLSAVTMQWSRAEEVEWGAGVRTGFSATSTDDHFSQQEAILTHNLPWRWQSGSSWYLRTRLDLSAGAIHGRGEEGFVGTLGPTVVLGKDDFPLTLEFGCSPTLLSKDEFGNVNFGVPFQFTSHVGVDCRIFEHLSVGYRLQHMSNAAISNDNPGLDLHMFAISYHF
jgi:hypothetical protein